MFVVTFSASVILNNLYKMTAFFNHLLALICWRLKKSVPKILSLKPILENYIEHQQEVVTRRTQFDKNKAEAFVLTSWKGLQLLLIILMKSLH